MATTPEEKAQLKNGLIKDLRSLFNQADSTAISNKERADFLAGPAPTAPLRRLGWDAGRRACRRWAAGRGPSIAPWRDLFTRDVCQPYIENDFGPLGAATSQPPFTGGQCPGVTYRVVAERFRELQQDWVIQATLSIRGPVTGRSIVTTQNPLRTTWTISGFNSSGQPATDSTFNGIPAERARWGAGPTRADGLPDNCGNLPDDFNPGTGPTIPSETGPIPSPPGWGIPDFDIDITLNPDGTIDVSFGDGEPDVTIDPGSSEPNGDSGPAPGDQGEPGIPAEAGDTDAEGEAPPGSVLVGVRLQLVAAPPGAKKFAPTVYRGAAYIYMGGDVGLDQDFAGSMLVADQFIYAEKDNLTRWKVVSNQGFRWNVTPYYREIDS